LGASFPLLSALPPLWQRRLAPSCCWSFSFVFFFFFFCGVGAFPRLGCRGGSLLLYVARCSFFSGGWVILPFPASVAVVGEGRGRQAPPCCCWFFFFFFERRPLPPAPLLPRIGGVLLLVVARSSHVLVFVVCFRVFVGVSFVLVFVFLLMFFVVVYCV
jgi:hypothetical protein